MSVGPYPCLSLVNCVPLVGPFSGGCSTNRTFIAVFAGGIITGAMSDYLNARATSSVIMMYLAVPTVSLHNTLYKKS